MSLIDCYECGKEISSLASVCPSCGAPKRESEQPLRHDIPEEHVQQMVKEVMKKGVDLPDQSPKCPLCGGIMKKTSNLQVGVTFGGIDGAVRDKCSSCGHMP